MYITGFIVEDWCYDVFDKRFINAQLLGFKDPSNKVSKCQTIEVSIFLVYQVYTTRELIAKKL